MPEFCITNIDGTKVYLHADDAKLYNTITSIDDQLCFQRVINRLKDWSDKWLLKVNVNKCKTVSYSLKNKIATEY